MAFPIIVTASVLFVSIFVVSVAVGVVRLLALLSTRGWHPLNKVLPVLPVALLGLSAFATAILAASTFFLTDLLQTDWSEILPLIAVASLAISLALRWIIKRINFDAGAESQFALPPKHGILSRRLFIASIILLIAAGEIFLLVTELAPASRSCRDAAFLNSQINNIRCDLRANDEAYVYPIFALGGLHVMLLLVWGSLRVGLWGKIGIGLFSVLTILATVWVVFYSRADDDWLLLIWSIGPLLVAGIILAGCWRATRWHVPASLAALIVVISYIAVFVFDADELTSLALIGLSAVMIYTNLLLLWVRLSIPQWQKMLLFVCGALGGIVGLSTALYTALPNNWCLTNGVVNGWFKCERPAEWYASFASGTAVSFSEPNFKPIEEINIGEQVRSMDLKTGEETWSRVTAIFSRIATDLYLIDDEMYVTSKHPFAVFTNGSVEWASAESLRRGDCLYVSQKACEPIESIAPISDGVLVHNLEVSPYGNYFVPLRGKAILVHNKSIPPPIILSQ